MATTSDSRIGTTLAGYRIERLLGRGRDERRLPGRGLTARPPGGAEADRAGARGRRALPRALPARVPDRRLARPLERDPDLRGRRGRRAALHRHALCRGDDAEGGDRPPRPAVRTPGARHRGSGGRRARPRPRTRPRPSGREAGEHPARGRGRARRGAARLPVRLRPDEAGLDRQRPDGDGAVRRNRGVHRAGADRARRGRRVERRLLARRACSSSASTGEPPFRRGFAHGPPVGARARRRRRRRASGVASCLRRIDRVLARGMAKAPRDRFASCGTLVAAARMATSLARPAPSRLERATRRPALLLAAVAAGAVLVALAIGAAVLLRDGEAAAGPTTRLAVDSLQRIDPATGRLAATVPLGSSHRARRGRRRQRVGARSRRPLPAGERRRRQPQRNGHDGGGRVRNRSRVRLRLDREPRRGDGDDRDRDRGRSGERSGETRRPGPGLAAHPERRRRSRTSSPTREPRRLGRGALRARAQADPPAARDACGNGERGPGGAAPARCRRGRDLGDDRLRHRPRRSEAQRGRRPGAAAVRPARRGRRRRRRMDRQRHRQLGLGPRPGHEPHRRPHPRRPRTDRHRRRPGRRLGGEPARGDGLAHRPGDAAR